MLQARELDCYAVFFEMTHDAPRCFADRDRGADVGALIGTDGSARLGDVDHAAGDIDAIAGPYFRSSAVLLEVCPDLGP
jgi:hypothetical protein